MFEDFDGVERQNCENDFDHNIYEALGCYVYLLRRDGRIFYVGKGGGKGMGNQRVLEHFDEAEQWLNTKSGQPSPKILEIAQAWRDEKKVEWLIVRRGLSEPEAFHVEAAVMDALSLSLNGETANIVSGSNVRKHGALSSADVTALAALPVNPNISYRHLFIFQIHNAYDTRDAQLATEGDWKVSAANRSAPNSVAVGLVRGVSRTVLRVGAWSTSPPGSQTYRFQGAGLPLHELLNKNFTNITSLALGFLQRGGGYVIVEFDGNGLFRFIRGSRDRETWHQL